MLIIYIFYFSPNLNENYKFYFIDDNNSEIQYTFIFGTSDTSGKQDGNYKSENDKKGDNADDNNRSNSSSEFLRQQFFLFSFCLLYFKI